MRNPRSRGSVLAALIFLTLLATALFLFALNVAVWSSERERQRRAASAAALSMARLHATSLETVATRWSAVPGLDGISADAGGVTLSASRWHAADQGTATLARGLSSYQGRIHSVATVVAGANGWFDGQTEQTNAELPRLGLAARSLRVTDPGGASTILSSGWLSRIWTSDVVMNYRVRAWSVLSTLGDAASTNAGDMTAESFASARVAWDVATDQRVDGNGGYAGDWPQAIQNGHLTPQRWPLFAAEVVEEGK